MNCRQRALAALNHREPDRVPLDFGGRQTTLHFAAHQALMKYLGFSGPEPPIRSYHTYLVDPDPQLLQRFERVSAVFFPKAPSDYVFAIDPATNSYVDEWGTTYHMPPGGFYYDMVANPLTEAESEADLAKYRWPNPTDPARIAGLPEKIRAAYAAGEKVVMICGAMPGLWEHAWYMFGMEQAFVNLGGNAPLIEAFTDRILAWQIAYWDMALRQVGDCVDVVQLNEDLGSQDGPMMAPATFRRVYKPRLRQLIAEIKQRTKAQGVPPFLRLDLPADPRPHRGRRGHPESGPGQRGRDGLGAAEEGVRQGPHLLGRGLRSGCHGERNGAAGPGRRETADS